MQTNPRTFSEIETWIRSLVYSLPADVLVDLNVEDRDLLKGRILLHAVRQGGISNSTILSYARAILCKKNHEPRNFDCS